MFKIYIDASERRNKIVTLLKDSEKVDEISGDIDIVSSMSEILKKNNLEIKNIKNFDFNPGPGSFTGLKIGATISNILNWALNKKDIKDLKYPEYGREPNITLKKDI